MSSIRSRVAKNNKMFTYLHVTRRNLRPCPPGGLRGNDMSTGGKVATLQRRCKATIKLLIDVTACIAGGIVLGFNLVLFKGKRTAINW